MKVCNSDFKKVSKVYKSLKSACKNVLDVTLSNGVACVNTSTTTAILDIDTCDYTTDLVLDTSVVDKLAKLKTTDDFSFTNTVIVGDADLKLDVTQGNLKLDFNDYKTIYTGSAKRFVNRLNEVLHSVCKEDARPSLCGVSIKDNVMFTVDGFRISTRKLDGYAKTPIILPKTLAVAISKVIKKPTGEVAIKLEDDKVAIVFENIVLSDSLIKADVSEYDKCFTTDYDYGMTLNRLRLLEALEFEKCLIADTKPLVKLEVNDHLKLEHSEIRCDSLKAQCKPLQIAFIANYLIEALKNSKDAEIELTFMSSLSPLIVYYSNGKDLILPVRLGC